MRVKKRLGEILVAGKLLTEEKLMGYLSEQRGTGLKLGEFLIKKGILSERQLVDVLSEQLRIKKYHPDEFPIDLTLKSLISVEIATKNNLAPLAKIGQLLKITMRDPTDIAAMDTVEVLTNLEVEPLICTENELKHLISSIYGRASQLTDVMENISDQNEDKDSAPPQDVVSEISSKEGSSEESPIIRLANSIILLAVKEGVSDIHISPTAKLVQVRFRIDGKLHEVPSPPKAMFSPLISRIKILAKMDIANSRIPQDGRFSLRIKKTEINIRVSTLPTIYGENLVMRLLNTQGNILTLDQLGMSETDVDKVQKMIEKPYGMILSTGPTGSGKSTTLFSILSRLNKPDVNIITLEDPVEFRLEKIRQVQLNTKAGMTFANGLRSILRQDPDIIMVGEIRDAETAEIAVQAALTGHRVLSTLHTNNSVAAITRLQEMGVEPFLVASVMLLSIGQRLVRTICPNCSEPYDPPDNMLRFLNLGDTKDTNFRKGRGCGQCMNIGYKGRIGLYEVLAIDEELQEMIIKGLSAQEIFWSARKMRKLVTLSDDAAHKVIQGKTTIEEVISSVMETGDRRKAVDRRQNRI